MNEKILVDSNILVYAYDRSEPEKQAKAIALLDHLFASGNGSLSTQVLAEFFVAATRKIAAPISVERALESLENLAAAWNVLGINSMIVLEAARGVRDHQFHYYDAQIWAVARLNQIPYVFSEDFNPARIEGVEFINPLAADFCLEDWG
jgi:predicted nucleic acid-binding protein